MYRALHFYDFDGTLFKSPGPQDLQDIDWWERPESLSPPVVPAYPEPTWWNKPVLKSAYRSISTPSVYTVMATGRAERPFRRRVEHLLSSQSLMFDEVHLNPGTSTPGYKSKLIGRLLDKLPGLDSVCLWDDKLEYLKRYAHIVSSQGISTKAYHVPGPDMTKTYHIPARERRLAIRVASLYVEAKGRKRLKQKTKKQLSKKKKKKDPDKRLKSWKQGVKIFRKYRKRKRKKGEKPRFENTPEGITAYLNMQGYWGFKKPKKKKKKKGLGARFKEAVEGLKVKSKGIAKDLREATDDMKEFIVDKVKRNKTLQRVGKAVDDMAPQMAKDLVNNFIGEAKGYKELAGTMKDLLTPGTGVALRMPDPDDPEKKVWNRDALAAMYGVGAYVAAGVGTAMTGGLGAVFSWGTAYAFTMSKSMHAILRTVPNTVYDAAARKSVQDATDRLKEAEKEVEKHEEGTEEYEEAKKEYDEAKKDYDEVMEKEAKVAKLGRILDTKRMLEKGRKGAEKAFGKLQEDYGDDETYGQYLQDKDSLTGMPPNRETKMNNELADLKKRGQRELLDRAFLGWEWAEVMSSVLSPAKPESGKTWGANLFDEDYVAKFTGGTNWLEKAAVGIGKAIKEGAKIVTSADDLAMSRAQERRYRRRLAAAGWGDEAKEQLEQYFESVVRAMADFYKEGFSDQDMEEILERNVEGLADGSVLSDKQIEEWKEHVEKQGPKKKEASFIAGQRYYDTFSWL